MPPQATQRNISYAIEVNSALNKYWGGGQILWVGNRTGLPSGDGSSANYPLATLGGAGGAYAKLQGLTNRGNVIFVLPGHAESISGADYMSAASTADSTAVVGLGIGTSRPTFTWTVALSAWLFDTANMVIDNCRLFLAGAHAAGSALTVAGPIVVSATGCGIVNCEVAYGFDADQIVTIGINLGTAATRFKFNGNDCYAEIAAAPTTTFLRLNGADFFTMEDTRIVGPGSSTTIGPIQELTTASLKKRINRCTLQSSTASSTVVYTAIAGTGNITQSNFVVGTGTLAVTASSGLTAGNTHTFSVASGLQTLLAIT